MKSLTRDQVRSLDKIAIERLGLPGLVLMENAGRQVADAAEQMLRELGGGRVAVVAGAGNNGGDGFVAARHLALRKIDVAVFLVAQPERLAGDAATNFSVIQKLGIDCHAVDGPALGALAGELKKFDLVIDAIGGTGIAGPLRGALAQAVEQVNGAGRPVLAVDIPTGLDCDTGLPNEPTIRAAVTVTMAGPKAGFEAKSAAAFTGKVVVADIGLSIQQLASF